MPQAEFTSAEDVKRKGGPRGKRSFCRGSWRMPSDGEAALWLEELEGLE